jgi:hypothetical protein
MTFVGSSPVKWIQTGNYVGTAGYPGAGGSCNTLVCIRTTTVRGYLEVQKASGSTNYEILSLGPRTLGAVENQRIEEDTTAGCYDLYSPYTTLQGTFCGFPHSGRADAVGEAASNSGSFPQLRTTYVGDNSTLTNSTLKVKGPSNIWETWDQILGTSDGTRRFDESGASTPYFNSPIHNFYYSSNVGG